MFEQTGAGTSMSTLGMPDLGIANGTDMVRNAGMIASLDPNIPVIADAGAFSRLARYSTFTDPVQTWATAAPST